MNTHPVTPNTTHSVGMASLKIKYSPNQLPQTNSCSGMYSDAESKEYQNNDLLQKYPCVLAAWCAESCTLTDTWKNPQTNSFTGCRQVETSTDTETHFFFLWAWTQEFCASLLQGGPERSAYWNWEHEPRATPCSNRAVHLNHKNCTDTHSVQSTKPGLCFVFS